MSRRRESPWAKCPFYHNQEAWMVVCEGVSDGNTIHLCFGDSKRADEYRKEFCCGNYKKCIICQMLYGKYALDG